MTKSHGVTWAGLSPPGLSRRDCEPVRLAGEVTPAESQAPCVLLCGDLTECLLRLKFKGKRLRFRRIVRE